MIRLGTGYYYDIRTETLNPVHDLSDFLLFTFAFVVSLSSAELIASRLSGRLSHVD